MKKIRASAIVIACVIVVETVMLAITMPFFINTLSYSGYYGYEGKPIAAELDTMSEYLTSSLYPVTYSGRVIMRPSHEMGYGKYDVAYQATVPTEHGPATVLFEGEGLEKVRILISGVGKDYLTYRQTTVKGGPAAAFGVADDIFDTRDDNVWESISPDEMYTAYFALESVPEISPELPKMSDVYMKALRNKYVVDGVDLVRWVGYRVPGSDRVWGFRTSTCAMATVDKLSSLEYLFSTLCPRDEGTGSATSRETLVALDASGVFGDLPDNGDELSYAQVQPVGLAMYCSGEALNEFRDEPDITLVSVRTFSQVFG